MKYVITYDEFKITEGFISNKIELYKNKINTLYTKFKGIQKILYKILGILFNIGIIAGAILWGIAKIHNKYPNFVKAAYSKSSYESESEDIIAKTIIEKFYNNDKLVKDILNVNVHNGNKIKNIEKQLKNIYTEEEINYLKNLQ